MGVLGWVHASQFVLSLAELLGFFREQILNGGVKQEVSGQIVDLSGDELKQLLHDCVHDANTMGADTVQHLIHADSLDLLGLTGPFYEDLSVQVIVVI